MKKNYLLSIILFIFIPIISVLTIVLFMIFAEQNFKAIGLLIGAALFLVAAFIIKPFYEKSKLVYKRERLFECEPKQLNLSSIHKENFQTILLNNNYIKHKVYREISSYYKVLSRGTIWFPGNLKVRVIITGKNISFKTKEIGLALAEINNIVANKSKTSNYEILVYNFVEKIKRSDLSLIKEIIFNKNQNSTLTQLNIVADNSIYALQENNNFYPTKEYKECCIEVHNLFK